MVPAARGTFATGQGYEMEGQMLRLCRQKENDPRGGSQRR